MNWLDDYRSKLQTPQQAVHQINSGDRVYYGGNAAIPQALVRALAGRADELRDVQLNHVLLVGDDPLSDPAMAPHFRHNSLFVGPADRSCGQRRQSRLCADLPPPDPTPVRRGDRAPRCRHGRWCRRPTSTDS